MDNKIAENWQEISKNTLAAAKELEAINASVIEKLTGKQMELANAALESGTQSVSALTAVKGYQELLAEQTKLAGEFNEKLIEASRQTADIITESREAYQGWLEKGFQTFAATTQFVVPNFAPANKPVKKAA